jgi:hypothetical protein
VAEESLPPVGTRVVHKDNYPSQTGPVLEVTAINNDPKTNKGKPIHLGAANHKLNSPIIKAGKTIPAQQVSATEYKENYKEM